MFCSKESNPTRNHLLEEHILWKAFQQKYDIDNVTSLKSIDLYLHHLILNDLRCRRAHIQSLINTVQNNVERNEHIDNAQRLAQELADLQFRMNNCFSALDDLDENPVNLLDDYQITLLPECHRFTDICGKISQNMYNLNATNYQDDYFDSKVTQYQALVAPNNTSALDTLLADLVFRQEHLGQLINRLRDAMHPQPNHPFTALFNSYIESAQFLIEDLTKIKERIETLCFHYNGVEFCLTEYCKLFTEQANDEEQKEKFCYRFIFLCEMLQCFIGQIEQRKNFPNVTHLIDEWDRFDDQTSEFKPKVTPLLQAIDNDMNNQNTQELPYRMGVVGYRSCGKSSLLNRLRDTVNDDDPLFSPVSLIKSTYCFLQYTVRREQCVITYVDVEGYDQGMYSYEQQIVQADCDAYIIVFDSTFSQIHLDWQKLIQDKLNRHCLLARCKADNLFLDCYSEVFHNKNFDRKAVTSTQITRTIQNMRTIVTKTESNIQLKTVYLVAPKYPHMDERIDGTTFAKFDLDLLRKELTDLAKKHYRYRERLACIAMKSGVNAVNVCFRRGYIISALRYQIGAGFASIVPFLEKVPAYFAREKVHQLLGIQDDRNSFENYLLRCRLTVPNDLLKSNVFKNLPRFNDTIVNIRLINLINVYLDQTKTPHMSSISKQELVRAGLTTVIDTGVFMGCTLVTIEKGARWVTGGGLILSVPMSIWSVISAKRQIDSYLNEICDDIVRILACFIAENYTNDV